MNKQKSTLDKQMRVSDFKIVQSAPQKFSLSCTAYARKTTEFLQDYIRLVFF